MAYHGATICLNGHVVSKYNPNFQPYCSQCGAETYSSCTQCHAPIHGLVKIEGVLYLGKRPYNKPFYCYQCGSPYPWTQKILDNSVELVSLDDELDDISKSLIKSAIPDLLVDTPTTAVAVAKYKKGISNASPILRDALYNLLVDVLSETLKKALFE